MINESEQFECDTCDTKLTKPNVPALTGLQVRFLTFYMESISIAAAARLARVHRSTAYRWMTHVGFVEAMQAAQNEYFQQTERRVRAEVEARRQWRQERETQRRPMRCIQLAKARAAKNH